MRLFGRREPALPEGAAGELRLQEGDRVLAWALDAPTGAHVVASLHALHHLPGGVVDGAAPSLVGARAAQRWSRPWLDVAAGAWEPHTRTLTVTWADGGTPAMWTFADDRVRLPSVLEERVRASVVISWPVLMGEHDLGRVALRKDLASGAVVEQTSLRRKTSASDPAVTTHVEALLRDLREQVGLQP